MLPLDLLSGNLSIRRQHFQELGGFRTMKRREDWEFGWRAAQAGLQLRSAPAARVLHRITAELKKICRDRQLEGAGDCEFVNLHPVVVELLPLRERTMRLPRALARLPARRAVLAAATWVLGGLADRIGRFGMRGQAQRILRGLFAMHYWSGVANAESAVSSAAEGSRTPFAGADFVETSNTLPVMTDVLAVLELASSELKLTPLAVRVEVRLDGHTLAEIPLIFGGVPFDEERFRERAAREIQPVLAAHQALARATQMMRVDGDSHPAAANPRRAPPVPDGR